MAKTSKAGDDETPPGVNQLLDMFIYAPIGMLYEYPEVLPQLVKKGKSQVQLAKVMGEFAIRKGQADPAAFASEGFASAGGAIAKLITELGEMFAESQGSNGAGERRSGSTSESAAIEAKASVVSPNKPTSRLPIANYDKLTAREIVGLLSDITPAQRARVRAHETQNRARKTVLSKLDQLGD
jgi:hypothetical protein